MIYRSMKADEDGLPVVERSAWGLGVRLGGPRPDVKVVQGMVEPGSGGMSVYEKPERMSRARRPTQYGGFSTKPLFGLDEADLPDGLSLTPPNPDTHRELEPARRMPIEEYEALLRETRSHWRRIL